VLTTQYERVARLIADQVAELLCAPIWVIDDQEAVVASNINSDYHFNPRSPASETAYLHIPVRFEGQSGTIIVGNPTTGEMISPRLAEILVQLVVNQVVIPNRSPQQQERKNTFIYDLLMGSLADEASVMREASILGLDLASPRAVILIDAAEYILATAQASSTAHDAGIRRRTQLVIGSIVGFFHLPNDTICAYIGNGQIAVLKACNTKNLVTWADTAGAPDRPGEGWANLAALKRAGEALLAHLHRESSPSISLGIGRYHPYLEGIARSYQDAHAALSLGRCCHGEYRAYCLDGLGTAAFVGIPDERTKVELATHLLSPLDHEPELIETLRTFFAENCCPSTTASRLVIHRNTLTYRLQKVVLLTGLDPRRFDDAAQIHLALLLRSFSSHAARRSETPQVMKPNPGEAYGLESPHR